MAAAIKGMKRRQMKRSELAIVAGFAPKDLQMLMIESRVILTLRRPVSGSSLSASTILGENDRKIRPHSVE